VEEPVIIEAAINGLTSKQQNTNVPRSAPEIASDALRCFAAGATIVHHHVDTILAEGPVAAEAYLECWRPVWQVIPEALLYPTVNAGSVEMSFAHLPFLAEAGCRIGILDAGSVNLGGFVYVNSRADIEHQVRVCAENHLGPSMAIFEPGFLRIALQLWQDGKLPKGAMIKLYFGGDAGYMGGVFGLPPTKPAFEAYMAMLEGCDLPWSSAVLGGDIIESGIARWTLERGGHLHVGLEDWSGDDQPDNEELVRSAVSLCADIGRPLANLETTHQVLGIAKQNG
jgi:uncharacterized protein (DUF849 family)